MDMWEDKTVCADYIEKRVRREAEYITETGATVREAAKHFSVSKSTVHKDVAERLCSIDRQLFEEVRKVLDKNLSERHIRGGMATRKKFAVRGKTSENEQAKIS